MSRGMSLVEMLCSVMLMMLVFLGFGTMLTSGLQQFQRIYNDSTVTESNAQNMRRITDALRGAMNISITNSGKTISFNYPKYSSTNDPVTGEKELAIPIVSDGVARGYTIDSTAGTLTDTNANRVLVKNIKTTDPEPNSSQFGQSYAPFSFSTVGGQQVVVVNLITQAGKENYTRYQRFKTAVFLRS